jgi:hypothetical protein
MPSPENWPLLNPWVMYQSSLPVMYGLLKGIDMMFTKIIRYADILQSYMRFQKPCAA